MLIRLLASPARNLMVVGDDDQLIYGFAGASPLTFSSLERDWGDMSPLPLDRNFRSPHDLVVRTGWLISHNTRRVVKNIEADASIVANDSVDVVDTDDYEHEALRFVRAMRAEGRTYADVALLFRSAAAAAPVELLFDAEKIPHETLSKESLRYNPTTLWLLAWLRAAAGRASQPDWRLVLTRPNRFLSNPTIDYILSASDPAERIATGAISTTGWPRKSQTQNDDLLCDALSKVHVALAAAKAAQTPSRMLEYLRLDQDLGTDRNESGAGDGTNTPEKVVYEVFRRLVLGVESVEELDIWLEATAESGDEAFDDDTANRQLAADRVILLTIHRAKGKEFPAVAVLGPRTGMPDPRALTLEALEEERRVAYVGATRALDRLLFCCSTKYSAELGVSPDGLDWETYKAERLEPGFRRPSQGPPPVSQPEEIRDEMPPPVSETEPGTLTRALRWLMRKFGAST
jgi:superfamily I DNA/RNA helicase